MLNVVFVTKKDNYSDDTIHQWIIEQLNAVAAELNLQQCELGLLCAHTTRDAHGVDTDYVHTLVACKYMSESHYVPSTVTVLVFDGNEFGNSHQQPLTEGVECIDRVLLGSGFDNKLLKEQKVLRASEAENYNGTVILVPDDGVYVELYERSDAHMTNQLGYQKPQLH